LFCEKLFIFEISKHLILMSMQQLNLPEFPFKIIIEAGIKKIFDPLRKKYIILSPEEWVRQHVAQYLINQKNVPSSLIALEREIVYNGLNKRFDILIHNKKGEPVMIVECKAPAVKIKQKTFDQAAMYAFSLESKYILVSNGISHFCFEVDRVNQTCSPLEDIPDFEGLE
jgi:Type I restriction enzyme R protein N terminus (HSDR_N)